MPTPKLIGTGAVRGKVIRPGEKGYHDITDGVRSGEYQRKIMASDRKWDRAGGKTLASFAAGSAAIPLAMSVPINTAARKQTERNQAKTKRLRASVGKSARVHDISTASYKRGPLERLGRVSPTRAAVIVGASYGAGIAGMGLATRNSRRRAQESARELRSAQAAARRAKKPVVKRGPKPSALKEHFGSPRKALATTRRNPEYVAAGGAAALSLGAQARPLERRRTPKQRDRADVGSAALAGGVGGHAAFRGAGYTVRAIGHKKERERPAGMSRSQHQKIMSNHYKSLGLRQNEKTADPKFYRTYPKGLPATPYKRALGQTSGKRGAAMLAATSLGGAYAAGASVRGRKKNISKSLYQREDRLSVLRSAQMAGGLGLLAWGTGRSKFLGAALARGAKAASGRNSAQAAEALRLALAAQGALRRGTAPGERALRQVRRINDAVNRVPGPIRPEVAGVAGLLLAGNAAPLRRTTYRQVSSPVRVVGRGW